MPAYSQFTPDPAIPYERSAAIYARVSSERQSGPDKYSEKTQVDECMKWAARQNPPLLVDDQLIVIEPPHTAEDLYERRALMHLIDLAEQGAFRYLICLQVKRLSRGGSTQLGMIMHRLEEAGVTVRFVMEDLGDAPFAGSIYGLHADHGRLENIERVEASLRTKRERAKHAYNPGNRPPFGYAWDPDDRDPITGKYLKRRLIEDPVSANIVRIMFRLLDQGETLRGVAMYLNGRNPEGKKYPTPRAHSGMRGAGTEWFAATVRQIVPFTGYWGQWSAFRTETKKHGPRDRKRTGERYTRKKYSAPLPPEQHVRPDPGVVVGPALLEDLTQGPRVLERLRIRRELSLRNVRVERRGLLQSGMAWCAYCGGMLAVKRSGETRKDGSRLLMYRCQTNVRQPGRCKGVNISQLPLDKAVWARILKLMSDRDYFRMMAEEELESQQSANNPESWLKDINKQIDDVALKQQSLAVRLSGYKPGEDDDIAAPVEEELRKLGAKKRELEARKNELLAEKLEAERRRAVIRSVSEWAELYRGAVESFSLDERHDILQHAFGVRVIVWRKEDRQPHVQLAVRISERMAAALQAHGVQGLRNPAFEGEAVPLTPGANRDIFAVIDEFDPLSTVVSPSTPQTVAASSVMLAQANINGSAGKRSRVTSV